MTIQDVLRAEVEPCESLDEDVRLPAVFTTGILLSCLLRTYFVAATFNTRGMQNVGFAYAIDPGLAAIYGACPEALQESRRRHVRHYNTHPFWTPYMVGLFLNIERKMALGLVSGKLLDHIRTTTMYTLSAIGDSFFGGSVMVFWALLTSCLVISGHGVWALVLGAAAFLSLQVFKAATFFYGFREGLAFLRRLKRWDLINWGRRIKFLNSGLLVLFWVLAWPQAPIVWYFWLFAALLMSVSAWLVMTLHLSRDLLAALGFAVYLAYPWLKATLAGLL